MNDIDSSSGLIRTTFGHVSPSCLLTLAGGIGIGGHWEKKASDASHDARSNVNRLCYATCARLRCWPRGWLEAASWLPGDRTLAQASAIRTRAVRTREVRVVSESRVLLLTVGYRPASVVGFAVTVATLSLLAAGCGGSGSPEVASVGASTPAAPTTQSGVHASAVAYANCMTAHGVAIAPPDNHHGLTILGNTAPNSTRFAAATHACRKLEPTGGPQSLTPAQQAQAAQALTRSAACMRKHNVPDFPDPNGHGTFPETQIETLNTRSPLFRQALKTCDQLYPKPPVPQIAFPGGSHT